jgi:hypothetical protein
MRKSTLVGGLAAALASMVLVLPPPVSAAPGGGSGEDYADLFVALRDEDGVPILSATFYEEGPVPVTCIQPISYAPVPEILPTTNPADGRQVFLIPLVGEGSTPDAPREADTACDPQADFLPYVSEVELERLNLVRTSDEVLWKKLVDVGARLYGADEITLDGAGRITTWTDGVATAIDASPDQASIYAANQGPAPAPPPPADGQPGAGQPGGLMDTGTIPHWLPVGSPAPNPLYPLDNPAAIPQGTGGFDNWDLAAAAIGTATSKSVPVTIDTVQYYNRIASRGVDNWGYAPKLATTANGEKFVDYSTFSYTRADVFEGCTIWLDVGTLTWEYGTVVDRIENDEFPDVVDLGAQPTPGTVTRVAGFTQQADDVRSVINYLHENEVVVDADGFGFYIDPVFQNTCSEANPDLAPEGVPLSQAEMVAYLNTRLIEAEPPAVTITATPAVTTTATEATFAFDASADTTRVLCVLDDGAIEDCLSPKTYTGLAPGAHTFKVIAMGAGGIFASDTYTWTILPPGEDSMITPLAPVRIADTRPGWVAADGLFFGTGRVPAGGIIQVPVAGRAGVPVGAKAVVANVTVTGATVPGFVTVFPCGTVPGTSSANYLADEAVANEVIAKLSPAGSICVYAHSAVHVIVDVAGYL